MKVFVCQPTESGHCFPFCVARINPKGTDYIPIRGEEYPTYEEAFRRAETLNSQYLEDCIDSQNN